MQLPHLLTRPGPRTSTISQTQTSLPPRVRARVRLQRQRMAQRVSHEMVRVARRKSRQVACLPKGQEMVIAGNGSMPIVRTETQLRENMRPRLTCQARRVRRVQNKNVR